MEKLTKRKGFNFYRSYYDVFNELSDKDKLSFINALLDKQFLDVDPVELKGMAKFAWVSQYNSIDQQVKGYKSKTKDPMQGGVLRVVDDPTLQEEEKEEEKEQYVSVYSFDQFWNTYPKKIGKKDCEKKYSKVSEHNRQLIKDTLNNFINNKPFADYNHPNPLSYINQERWIDVIETPKQQNNATKNGVIFGVKYKGNL